MDMALVVLHLPSILVGKLIASRHQQVKKTSVIISLISI